MKPENTPIEGTEIDQLLEAAAKRGLPLKMPKSPEHWKQRRQRLLERSRKHEQRTGTVNYRKLYRGSLRGQWLRLKAEMIRRGHRWELDLSDWLRMWTEAKPAVIGTMKVPAWTQRGRGKNAVQLFRIEKEKGFVLENIEIWYKEDRLWP